MMLGTEVQDAAVRSCCQQLSEVLCMIIMLIEKVQ